MNYAISILGVLQLFFAIIIGMYFWNLLKKQYRNKSAVKHESKKEMRKLYKMRKKSLTKPLAEKIRPGDFDEIVGQKDGLKALKAALCGPNPQHVIIYGPPGVGKTAASRLVLAEAQKNEKSPFADDAEFVELDATTARFDERGIADPLIGSVHDPIYQGAGAMGNAGIPQPKPGAVTKAHGGMLFIDEIGELHHIQMNKLLKVLEDRKVFLESSYYQGEDNNIPNHIHSIFQDGLPADFRLIGATTKQPSDIPPAVRSRCLEIFFRPLLAEEIEKIVYSAIEKINFKVDYKVIELIKKYAQNGRQAVNMIQSAGGIALTEKRDRIEKEDIQLVLANGQYNPRPEDELPEEPKVGIANGLAVVGANLGTVNRIEVSVVSNKRKKGELKITGVVDEEEQNGKFRKIKRKSMIKESAQNVITLLKKMKQKDLSSYDIHIDFTSDAVVDGPSAGLTMAVALFSALTANKLDNKVAMTGKISINGNIMPVGGINPKLRAALNAGVNKVLIPEKNIQNIFADGEFDDLEIIPVNNLAQALKEAVASNNLDFSASDLRLKSI